MNQNNIAEVAVDLPFENSYHIYDYKIPKKLMGEVIPGIRVVVPFSGRQREGYIVNTKSTTSVKTKEIILCIDDYPLFNREMMDLARWMSENYLCSMAKSLQCMIPSGLKYKFKKKIKLTGDNTGNKNLGSVQKQIIDILKQNQGEAYYSDLLDIVGRNLYSSLKSLKAKALIKIEGEILSGIKPKRIKVVQALPGKTQPSKQRQLTDKLKQVLEVIIHKKELSVKEISSIMGEKYSTIYSRVKRLEEKGFVRFKEREVYRNPLYNYRHLYKTSPTTPKTLTMEQQQVLHTIERCLDKDETQGLVLHGVTGSGKTEVYKRTIQKVLNRGRTAILLVPEISLTSRMIREFVEEFGTKVALLHSKLSPGERFDEWRKIKQGRASIVIGTRSAVFAPLEKLGIIIIDEEHENTYKQEENPKYHTRDVALWRCKYNNALLVMGSATPSLETYYKAKSGVYILTEMKHRVDSRPLPPVDIIDMRLEIKSGNKSIFSRALYKGIKHALGEGEQVILFLNRRGFSTFVLCRECGYVIKCPYCDISLTYHFDTKILKCHYCDYTMQPPDVCPNCRSTYIRFFGLGTQKVEQLVKKYFKEARVSRLDVDATVRKGSHETILNDFNNGKIDILIGTQMVAKGLDNPGVGLVGVITADTSLNLPDFRAGERTFQLTTQVAGRTGRGDNPGRVIVQTYAPEHFALKCASQHDYIKFYHKEIKIREQFEYPPFSELVNILLMGEDENKTAQAANDFAEILSKALPTSWDLLGPCPAPISKIKGNFRWQIILKGTDINSVKKPISQMYFTYKREGVKIYIDFNPYFIL